MLRKLCLALMPKLDDELRHSTAQDAAFYEHRLQVGRWGRSVRGREVRYDRGPSEPAL